MEHIGDVAQRVLAKVRVEKKPDVNIIQCVVPGLSQELSLALYDIIAESGHEHVNKLIMELFIWQKK